MMMEAILRATLVTYWGVSTIVAAVALGSTALICIDVLGWLVAIGYSACRFHQEVA